VDGFLLVPVNAHEMNSTKVQNPRRYGGAHIA